MDVPLGVAQPTPLPLRRSDSRARAVDSMERRQVPESSGRTSAVAVLPKSDNRSGSECGFLRSPEDSLLLNVKLEGHADL